MSGFKEFGQLKNVANIGDIIEIVGYPGQKFRVGSYTHELDFQPDYVDEAILYDAYDVITGEYMLAYQDDVTVVVRGNAGDKTEIVDTDFGWEYIGEMTFEDKEADEMRSQEMTKQERIDRLLTEIVDYQYLIRNFGDDNNEYKTKIEYAKMQLEGMTKKEEGK